MRYILQFLKKYVFIIISLIIVFSIFIFQLTINNTNDIVKALDTEEKQDCNCEEKANDILIDIKGAVKKPGVYLLSQDSIVNDAINAAGGLLKGASTDDLNLSKKIYNEMVIYVSTKVELKEKQLSNSIQTSNTTTQTNNINDICITNKVNINSASLEELTSLTGVGESKALAIIEYRKTNGLFKSIDELKNVSGIGEAAYEKIKNNITI